VGWLRSARWNRRWSTSSRSVGWRFFRLASPLGYCAYLSVALLVGLLANALAGWWWADPAAALVIAAVVIREGRESWRGEGCCDTC
jgi:uncharacterized membrane protein YbhN (UPF0104 family)